MRAALDAPETLSGVRGSPPPSAPRARPAARKPKDWSVFGALGALLRPKERRALLAGCRELALGNPSAAITHLRKTMHLADGALVAGFLALRQGHLRVAEDLLGAAAESSGELGRSFERESLWFTIHLPITDDRSAIIEPDIRGALLGLAVTYRRQGRTEEMVEVLERLRQTHPDDPAINLLVESASR